MKTQTVSYHSQTRNGVRVARIVQVSAKENDFSCEQTSLFNKEVWEYEMRGTIKKFKTFFPSDARLVCRYVPPFDKDSGPFYKKLLREGVIRRTGNYRTSACSSRRGGVEFEYEVLNG